MNINIISRGKGKSAVGAAAYRAGEKIINEYDGLVHDYAKKSGIVKTEILLPENALAEYANRSILWNAVEKIEKNKNAQLAREVRLALPTEFSFMQNLSLVREYVRKNFVDKGMCADICIHDKGDGNPHAHVLLVMRPFEKDGSWGAKSRMEYILDDNGERIKLPSGRYKTRKISATDWDERSNAEKWRASWADILNKYLDKTGHEIRVDHRSYERQDLDIIPTIHLGVVAHGLEKRGIATERGDINRKIREANVRLKVLDAKIYELQNPPIPQMIIDLEKSIKAKDNPAYTHWAKIFNLKQAAQTLIYIQDNGFMDMDSLQQAHQNANDEHTDIEKQIKEIKDKVQSLATLKEQTEVYRNTRDVYRNYTKLGQLSFTKKNYYAKNKAEIDRHTKARAYIFDEQKRDKLPSIKNLVADISKLRDKEKELQATLLTSKEKKKSLLTVAHNARMLLGYQELETKNSNPVATPTDPKLIPVYKSSFAESEKAGEIETYFLNCRLNKECAEAIQQAILKNKGTTDAVNNTAHYDMKAATNEVIEMYGKERADWVVAAIVMGNTSGKLSEHEKWASQKKIPDEPLDIHPLEHDNILDGFIKRFVEVIQQKSAKGNLDRKPSFAERLAAAEKRVREQDRGAGSVGKPGRGYGPDL